MTVRLCVLEDLFSVSKSVNSFTVTCKHMKMDLTFILFLMKSCCRQSKLSYRYNMNILNGGWMDGWKEREYKEAIEKSSLYKMDNLVGIRQRNVFTFQRFFSVITIAISMQNISLDCNSLIHSITKENNVIHFILLFCVCVEFTRVFGTRMEEVIHKFFPWIYAIHTHSYTGIKLEFNSKLKC